MMMWYFPSIFYRLHGLVLSLHSWVDDRQKVGRKSSILLPRNVCDARSATNATTHPWKIRNHSKNLTLQIPNSSFWPRVAKHRGPKSVLVVVAVLQILLRKSFKTWFKLNFLAVSVWNEFQACLCTTIYVVFNKLIVDIGGSKNQWKLRLSFLENLHWRNELFILSLAWLWCIRIEKITVKFWCWWIMDALFLYCSGFFSRIFCQSTSFL